MAAGRRQAKSSSPAMANREPAMSSGGIVVTATRMARYVEPQSTYTVNSAAHTSAGCAAGCCAARTWVKQVLSQERTLVVRSEQHPPDVVDRRVAMREQ